MMLEFFALSPVVLLIVILLFFKKPLVVAAPFTFFYALFVSIFYWSVKQEYVVAGLVKALFVSLDILLIIFGAVLFLEYLKNSGLIKKIEKQISSISSDRRVQAIIIIWFFGSFIEGTAGFGTPAAITAPFLVAIGFPAVLAVVLALIGNSTAVVFGAVGTPIRIGFEGLDVSFVSQSAAFINLFAGLVVPLLLIGVMTRYENKSFKYFYESIPFALWAGFCFLVPYFLLSFIGPEFPSLLGPLIGLVIIVFTTKKHLFVPKKTKVYSTGFNFKDFMPYVILISLLLLGKYVFPSFSLDIVFGVSHTFSLYNPGFIFLLSILFSSLFFSRPFLNFKNSFVSSFKLLFKPFLVIFFITAFVQLLILSSFNYNNYLGMLNVIANLLISDNYLLLSPVLGVFGSFLSGSATVSNLLFGALQVESAQLVGVSVVLVLALQVVGAGVGNMISLTNIVAAQTTVKLKNQELNILKKTVVPALIYLVFVMFIGLIVHSLF